MATKILSSKVHSAQPGKKSLWVWIPHGVSKWSGAPEQVMWHSFNYVDKKVLVTLYKSMIRPNLEYAGSIWSPHTWKQAEEIEIQRGATKRVAMLCDLPYKERLKALHLPTLVYRRLRGSYQCMQAHEQFLLCKTHHNWRQRWHEKRSLLQVTKATL